MNTKSQRQAFFCSGRKKTITKRQV